MTSIAATGGRALPIESSSSSRGLAAAFYEMATATDEYVSPDERLSYGSAAKLAELRPKLAACGER